MAELKNGLREVKRSDRNREFVDFPGSSLEPVDEIAADLCRIPILLKEISIHVRRVAGSDQIGVVPPHRNHPILQRT